MEAKFKNSFIHKSASIIGLVEMGENCSIWPGSVLRADMNSIVLGKSVNIQDNSTLHVDSSAGLSIGDYTLVGHNTMLHSCKIGKACLIGIGSIILDKAEIGDGAMITAGCMIRGGMKIPSKAMVIQKEGKLLIYENKAKIQLTIAGSIEYMELAARYQKNLFGPFTKEEEHGFYLRAGIIMEELGLHS
ncbi:MAG: gamma carbonic anhydrase family protein [Leptospiraceae bacterium]|nr:gamma carbonic anhydrase family protein [Leptospiraceae bacterium]